MFRLTTERLFLIPLDREGLEALWAGKLGDELRMSAVGWLDGVRGDPVNYLWYTNWQLVLRAGGRVVGGLQFKGPAGSAHAVEIACSVEANDRGQGFATEAVAWAAEWALGQHGVRAVLAETKAADYAAQRVLEKAGFRRLERAAGSVWWRRGRVKQRRPLTPPRAVYTARRRSPTQP